jgi:hypothetical protein
MEDNQELLARPITELPVGDEIQTVCRIRGFKNLKGLLEVSDYDMVHKLGFSYHAVIDLFGYLQSHGLGHLMENPKRKQQ